MAISVNHLFEPRGAKERARRLPFPAAQIAPIRNQTTQRHEWTYSEFLEYVERFNDHASHTWDHVAPEWCWNATRDEALRKAREGWPEGVKLAEGYVGTAVEAALTRLLPTDETRHDVSGAVVDMGRFLEGDPECMLDFCERETDRLHLEMEFDGFVSGSENATDMFWRGVNVAAAVIALQRAGILVDVYMSMEFSQHAAGTSIHRVHLAEAGRPTDVSELVFALAHPAFIRKLFYPATNYVCGVDAGHSQARQSPRTGPGKVFVSGMLLGNHPWTSPDACRMLVEECFKQAKAA